MNPRESRPSRVFNGEDLCGGVGYKVQFDGYGFEDTSSGGKANTGSPSRVGGLLS